MENLKELEKFLKLCRKHGVQSMRYKDVEVHLGDPPQSKATLKANFPEAISSKAASIFNPGTIQADVHIPTDEMTEEQILFGSSDPSVWTKQA